VRAKSVLAPATIDTVRAMNRLRNSVAHRGAVYGVTVSGTAQGGVYKGGYVFTALQALKQLGTDANAAITAMNGSRATVHSEAALRGWDTVTVAA
jgi:hypothetical protein